MEAAHKRKEVSTMKMTVRRVYTSGRLIAVTG